MEHNYHERKILMVSSLIDFGDFRKYQVPDTRLVAFIYALRKIMLAYFCPTNNEIYVATEMKSVFVEVNY